MKKPSVGIIMGSESDMKMIEKAFPLLNEFGISYQVEVASAHRTPKKVKEFISKADGKYDLLIAAAGMAAHLPGVIASYTTLPVIGIPVGGGPLSGFDSLYSIVQMPPGVPVATVAIDGSKNAAILAAQILSLKYPALKTKLIKLKDRMAKGAKI